MTATNKLALELLAAAAANQTLANTTFAQLNQLVQAGAVDKDLAAPPVSPANEALYIVASSATGAWAGKDGQLAYWLTSTNAWQFIVPREGFLVHVNDEDDYYKYDGAAWAVFSPGGGLTNPMTALGDIIRGGASGVPERVAVGADGQVLTVVSGAPGWAAPAGGGGSGSPGGSDTQLQYNDGGALGGASGLAWNKTDSRLTAACQIVATPPVAAVPRSLIGQGVTTEVGTYINPAGDIVSGERYYTVAIEAVGDQIADSALGHVVPLYTACNGKMPGGQIWGLNSLVRVDASMTSGEAIGFELDINNHSVDSLTPASALKVWGMTVSGGGAGRRISGFSLQGPSSGWNYGLTFYNNVLSGGQSYIYSGDTTFPARGIDFSNASFSDAAIKLASGVWSGGGGQIGVGTSTPASGTGIEVTGTTGVGVSYKGTANASVGFLAKGAASQTGDLIQTRDSSDNITFAVEASGRTNVSMVARSHLRLRSGSITRQTHIMQHSNSSAVSINDNVSFNGTNWVPDSTLDPVAQVSIDAGADAFLVRRAAAGINPVTAGDWQSLLRVTVEGNVTTGALATLATTATDGFLYIPTMAGAPTGTPTSYTGKSPIVVDSTNNRLYVRVGATWRYSTLT